ncbi:type VII toxin-antitoxin system MntA family adenylyltransferase antitoxin [Dethiobacter alkaliphilus]|uniref:DNA polymerase beta domain protein region n=1 Tax=Dethiobacter alkaliphilus AHT 1 TaxID=555088 RepID=C0GCZ8_DETAL|nr:nucleotidyltransferase domain-containing protein [Dethiobacter alkaliphilus]EEG79083.1 DNA polymerase beta domain protein region [Dethiobacter alkaliphilus AHT 1]
MSEMLKLDDKLLALRELFPALPHVQTVFLFGSYGTEYQTPLSDIDFAVYFNKKVSVDDEADLLSKLSIALDTDRVDLVNLNKAPLSLQFNVISEGKIIYERDYIATCDFIEKVIKYYQDYAITLHKFNRVYDQSFREAYRDGE